MRKNFINIFFITLFIYAFGINSSLLSQEENSGNIFVVTTFEMAFKPGNTMAEFDSLNKLYTEKVISKNNLIVSQRTLRHFWGHNNRDFVVITEVKNWGDIIEANKLSNELFEKAWPTEEARKEYNDANNKYFTGKHSDEIYQENAGGRVR